MRRHRVFVCLLVLVLIGTTLTPGHRPVQAQGDDAYVPSGIPVTELGDTPPPGLTNVHIPLQDPARVGAEIQGLLSRQPSTAPPVSPLAVPAITAEIQALAIGLDNDPLALYDYVHNQIDYIPTWGVLKNPRETLLAGAGNAFEQAALLAALLNAAGLETRYVWGEIQVTKTVAMNWVGAADPAAVPYVFANGGIPTAVGPTYLVLDHIWLQVRDGGQWRDLDPSFKTYQEQAGQDLRPLMGYTAAAFRQRAEAGASINADSVQNLNAANVRADLQTYAQNLIGHLRRNETFVEPGTLIGERAIVPVHSSQYPTTRPYTVRSVLGQAAAIPDRFVYELQVQLPGIDYTTQIPAIAGERVTIFYECATPADCQRLRDGGGIYEVYPAYEVQMVPKLRVGGQVVATGSAVPLGTYTNTITLTMHTPLYGGRSYSSSQWLTAGARYALPMHMQTTSLRALARQTELLDQALALGLDVEDERFSGQVLHLLGLSYFNEVELGDRIDARMARIVHIPLFSIMIASRDVLFDGWDSQGRITSLAPGSHMVDVRLNFSSAVSAENPAVDRREVAWFLAAGVRGSAAEHAILEQLQPLQAVSTIQILRTAIEDGQRIYTLTAANWQSRKGELNHPDYIIDAIQQDVLGGRHVVIHQDAFRYNDWEGSGWITLDPSSGSAGYMISGGLQGEIRPALWYGGSGSIYPPPDDERKALAAAAASQAMLQPQAAGSGSGGKQPPDDDPDEDERDLADGADPVAQIARGGQPGGNEWIGQAAHQPEDPSQRRGSTGVLDGTIIDPLDAVSGAFFYQNDDLAPLGGLGPDLRLQRTYASYRRLRDGPLGLGWSHNYDVSYDRASDWARVLGGRTALEAAPALAAAQVSFDLFDAAAIPHQRYSMSAVVAYWLTGYLTDNAAALVQGDGSLQVQVRLADGRYMPLGRRMPLRTVSESAGGATLEWDLGEKATFDGQGRLTSLEDANGNRSTLVYNASGLLARVTDAAGRKLEWTYDGQGRLQQVTDPAGRVRTYAYSASGDLVSYTAPDGATTSYTYDNHRLTRIVDPEGIEFVRNEYDALSRVARQVNGRGNAWSLRYGGYHTTVTGPLGETTRYSYDAQGRITAIVDALGYLQRAAYDAADHLTERVDGSGARTVLAYDGDGRLARITDPLGYELSWTHDAAGNPARFTDRSGNTWTFAYDARHNLTRVTNPLSQATDYTYDGKGQLTRAQNAAGIWARYSYDTDGNWACVTNAQGQSCLAYDQIGRPTGYTDALGAGTSLAYDAVDRLVSVTDPLNNVTRYTYDRNGSLTGVTDPKGHTTSYTYDGQFNLVRVVDADGGTTAYSYDARDDLVQATDANNHRTTYLRDALGRLTGITDPLGRTVRYEYDGAGSVVAHVRADGSRIAYQRDALGRLTQIDHPSSADVSLGYTPDGRLAQAALGSTWSATFAYDAAGRLTTVRDTSRNLTFAYAYDAAGQRTALNVKRGTTALYDLTYSYNETSLLAAWTDRLSEPDAQVSYQYDAAGRLEQIAYPGGALTAYSYDTAGRLVQVRHQDNRGARVAAYGYTYDRDGNPVQASTATPAGTYNTTYSYDALDRLVRESYPRYAIDYTYDAVGNLTRRADARGAQLSAYDAADQLITRAGERFGYDPHGNRTSWDSARGHYSYSYDDTNRLTEIDLPDSAALSYAYDAFGRRIAAQEPGVARAYVHDGLDILLEGNNSLAQVEARYIYGDHELAARSTEALGLSLVLGDGRQDVRYLASAGGQPLDAYAYDAYGGPAHPAGIDALPFGFLGQRSVLEPDLATLPTLTSYRAYDPAGARFFTRDPLPGNAARPLTGNDYLYGQASPLRYSDPSGLRDERHHPPAIQSSTASSAPNEPAGVVTGLNPKPSVPARQDLQRAVSATEPPPVQSASTIPGKLSKSTTAPAADAPRWLAVARHGTTYALACTADERLLAGSFQAGLYGSTNAQKTAWQQAATAGINEIVHGSGASYYAGARLDGALASSDGGLTWQPIVAGLSANDVYALAVDPASPQRLFAGTEMGLYLSQNGGAQWGRPASSPPGRVVSELAFAGNVLLAATDYGLYRSTNGGASWASPATDLPPARVNVLLAGSAASVVYAGTDRGPYISTDRGDTWAPWGTGLVGIAVHALAVDPANAQQIAAGTPSGLYLSTDGGTTWHPDNNPGLDGPASQVGALAYCSGELFVGAGLGVYALRVPPPPVAPTSVTIAGPAESRIGASVVFTATVAPGDTTLPLDYTWEAEGESSDHLGVDALTNVYTHSFAQAGNWTIRVTVSNDYGTVQSTHTIAIVDPTYRLYLPLVLLQ